MNILFIGTGSAFTTKNWNTNFIVEKNNKRLLLDCGGDVRHALNDHRLSYKDIDAIYISHLHDIIVRDLDILDYLLILIHLVKKKFYFMVMENF